MSILDRLDEIEKQLKYHNSLIASIDDKLNKPFKYSKKKTTDENKEIMELKDIIGITKT